MAFSRRALACLMHRTLPASSRASLLCLTLVPCAVCSLPTYNMRTCEFQSMLALAPLAAGLCTPGATARPRSPRPLCARPLSQVLPAPRMVASEDEEAAVPRTGKSEVFGEMSAEAQAAFLRQLDEECAAAGVAQSSRFRGLLDAMREGGDAEWRVLSTGQIVQSAKHFPGLTAMPAWEPDDFDEGDQPFPWLSKLEACVPAIAAELRAVCDAELPPGSAYDRPRDNLPTTYLPTYPPTRLPAYPPTAYYLLPSTYCVLRTAYRLPPTA